MSLPPINQRIKDLIIFHANGSVKKFSELIDLNSSQVLNRIFNKDKRSEEYPTPSVNILLAIANKFEGLNCNWLLTGVGEMYPEKSIDINISGGQTMFSDNITQKGKGNVMQQSGTNDQLESLQKELEYKTRENEILKEENEKKDKIINKLLDK